MPNAEVSGGAPDWPCLGSCSPLWTQGLESQRGASLLRPCKGPEAELMSYSRQRTKNHVLEMTSIRERPLLLFPGLCRPSFLARGNSSPFRGPLSGGCKLGRLASMSSSLTSYLDQQRADNGVTRQLQKRLRAGHTHL